MSSPSPKDSTSTREVLAIVGGGLLVLVCCAGPALLAAGVLGAAAGVLRNPVLVAVAGLVVAIAVGALALRRAGDRAKQSRCPPPADSGAGELAAPGRPRAAGLPSLPTARSKRCVSDW
jgi:mercuric ion transport protein